MIYRLAAHAEDLHTEATSNLVHTLTQPAPALALFLGGLGGILLLARTVFSVSPPKQLMLILFVCLTVGVLTYSLVPAVSILAISFGILLALFFTLASIA